MSTIFFNTRTDSGRFYGFCHCGQSYDYGRRGHDDGVSGHSDVGDDAGAAVQK